MANCREADLRLEAQTAIATIITAANQVQLGMQDQAAGFDFLAAVPVGGFAIVLPAENGPWNGQTRHLDIIIKILIYFSAAADANVDFIAIENVWTAVRDALANSTSWPRSAVDEMRITGPEPRTDLKPLVFMYTFELTFPSSSGTA